MTIQGDCGKLPKLMVAMGPGLRIKMNTFMWGQGGILTWSAAKGLPTFLRTNMDFIHIAPQMGWINMQTRLLLQEEEKGGEDARTAV
jgi:hypothetical protein